MVLNYSQQQQQLSSKFAAFLLLIATLWPIETESSTTSALRAILFPGEGEHRLEYGEHQLDEQQYGWMSDSEQQMMDMTQLSLCSSTGDYWCEHPDEYPEEVVSRILGRLRERREREHHEHDVMVAAMGQESPQPRSGIAASTADGMEPLVIPERSKKMLPNMMMPDIVATFFAPVQVDVSGRALMDSPPSATAMAGNEIEDELMLIQPRFMPMPGMGGIVDDDSDYAEVEVVPNGRSRGRSRNRSKGSRKKWKNKGGGGGGGRNRVAQVFPVRYPETLAAKSSTYTPTTAAPSSSAASSSSSSQSAAPESDDNRLKEVPMCSAITSYAFPKRGRNNKGEYKFLVADPDTHLVQAVRIENCRRPEGSCQLGNGMGFSDYGIETVCRQQFSYRKMLAVSSKGEEEVDFFQFPSGCQCFHKIAA